MPRHHRTSVAVVALLIPLAVLVVNVSTATPAAANTCTHRTEGDVNGDGISDMLVGQPNRGNGGAPYGAVDVILGDTHGGVTGAGSQFVTEAALGLAPRSEDQFGMRIATGFFNNDCYADALIGALQYPGGGGGGPGSVIEVLGSSSGLNFATAHRFIATQFSSVADQIGSTVTVGDFNHDGYDDAALGASASDGGAGGVGVIYGSSSGLTASTIQWFAEGVNGVSGGASSTNGFGSSVAAGDFNKDGYADLAIGAPGQTVNGHPGAGAVITLHGGGSGLASTDGSILEEGYQHVPGVAETDDAFGYSLAAGDVTDDGYIDLAIGDAGEVDGSASGAVFLVKGSGSGLTGMGSQYRDQISNAFPRTPFLGNLGTALAIGDFNDDGYADIACGVGNTDVDGAGGAGAFAVLYGDASGMTTSNTEIISQDTANVPGVSQNNDQLGDDVKVLPVTSIGDAGLMVAAPGESSGGSYENGGIEVFHGSVNGITAAGSQYFDGGDVAGGIAGVALMGAITF